MVARSAPRLIPRPIVIMDELLIFHHPVPIGEVHLLAIPRGMVPDAHARSSIADGFWIRLENWLHTGAARFGVKAGVTNIGTRQDVRLLHVHLLGHAPGWLDTGESWRGATLLEAVDGMRNADAERTGGSWASYGFGIGMNADWQVARIDG